MAESVKKMHPSFEYRLWTYEDFTRQNFPYLYDIINYVLKRSRLLRYNYISLAVGMMRIEILYHHGGIYMDYKVEMFKSMIPFLKYKQFFLEVCSNQRITSDGRLIVGA